jgi:hypothetical protein
MDPEHPQPATTAPSLSPVSAEERDDDAGLPPAELEGEVWLERTQEYAELGGEG